MANFSAAAKRRRSPLTGRANAASRGIGKKLGLQKAGVQDRAQGVQPVRSAPGLSRAPMGRTGMSATPISGVNQPPRNRV